MSPEFIITVSKRWSPGQTVRVAFNGGSTALHKDIADTAVQWLDGGVNLKLDFGLNAATGEFRKWSSGDAAYGADIRISFDRRGYWSMVGTDAVDALLVRPGEPSMNLSGFADVLSPDWKAVVLHEFGHALSFQHEHQHMIGGCDTEFRWEDDPGYTPQTDGRGHFVNDDQGRRPGPYTFLSGYPNYWPKHKVDLNLRQLPRSDAFEAGTYDGASIMKYYFGTWMFRRGDQSHCYTNRNTVLSPGDRAGIERAYGKNAEDQKSIVSQQRQVLQHLAQLKELSKNERTRYRSQLDMLDE